MGRGRPVDAARHTTPPRPPPPSQGKQKNKKTSYRHGQQTSHVDPRGTLGARQAREERRREAMAKKIDTHDAATRQSARGSRGQWGGNGQAEDAHGGAHKRQGRGQCGGWWARGCGGGGQREMGQTNTERKRRREKDAPPPPPEPPPLRRPARGLSGGHLCARCASLIGRLQTPPARERGGAS